MQFSQKTAGISLKPEIMNFHLPYLTQYVTRNTRYFDFISRIL